MSEQISKKKNKGLRRSLIILSVLLGLAVISLPFIDKNIRGTVRPEMKDFAIEHPEKVDKIYMASRSGNKIFLEKNKEGTWTVNGKYPAQQEKVKMFLEEYLARIRVKNPIPKEGIENVKRDMAALATKVEVYENGKKIKTYYVGGNTADELGSFMFMEGSSVPFVVHIPGFPGYPSAVYNLDEKAWRSMNIFHTDLLSLSYIEVIYPSEPEASFRIDKKERKLELRGHVENAPVKGQLNEEFLKQYAATYENLHFEGFFPGNAKVFADSVIRAHKQPYATITVGKLNKEKTTLDIYRKPVTRETKQQYDEQGKPLEFDQDRYYAIINGNMEEPVSVQSYVFKNVLKKLGEFYK